MKQGEMVTMTEFAIKCEILGEFYSQYRDESDFADFIESNDIGLTLAYFVSQSLCDVSDGGLKFINSSWESFMDTLELEDTGFRDLNDVFLASGMDV